jgi:hypothetical protein
LQVLAFLALRFLFGSQLGGAVLIVISASPATGKVILQSLAILISFLSQQNDILPFAKTQVSRVGGCVAKFGKDPKFA